MKQFGLIGKPLSHSFSKSYFSNKFKDSQLNDCFYDNFELDSIADFTPLIQRHNFKGINVTSPYKEEILSQLDEIETTAKKIGAVNTIQFLSSGKTKGHNTDVIGFRNSIKPFLNSNHTRALIFGTGGASKAISFSLSELGIPYYSVSRKPSGEKEMHYSEIDQSTIQHFKFLINCTPLGTYPNINRVIPIDFNGITEKHLVFDLVYNPKESLLLKEAKKRNAIAINGLTMLKLQAEASWKIWNNL